MTASFEPFLFDFFQGLQKDYGFPLDDRQYTDFVSCFLQSEIHTQEELRFLCKTLWLSQKEQELVFDTQFNSYFEKKKNSLLRLLEPKINPLTNSESKKSDVAKHPTIEPDNIQPPIEEPEKKPENGNLTSDSPSQTENPIHQPESELSEINLIIKDGSSRGGGQSKTDSTEAKIKAIKDGADITFLEGKILPFNTRKTTQILRKLPAQYVKRPTYQLDIEGLIQQLSADGFIHRLEYQMEKIRAQRVVWLSDHDGSMNPFQSWEDALLRVITNTPHEFKIPLKTPYLDRFYFHDFPTLSEKKDNFRLFENRAHTEATSWIKKRKKRKWGKNTLVVIFSDGGAAHRKMDFDRVNVFFEIQKIIKQTIKTKKILWLNPVKQIKESSANYISYFTEMIYPDDKAFQRFASRLPQIETIEVPSSTAVDLFADLRPNQEWQLGELTEAKGLDSLNQARIEAFWEVCPNVEHWWLLCHAAFSVALTTDLLQQIWYNFQKDEKGYIHTIPLWIVDEVIHSPVVREIGHDLYEIYPDLRLVFSNYLKKNKRFGENREMRLAVFMEKYVEHRKHYIPTNALVSAETINYERFTLSSDELSKKINRLLNDRYKENGENRFNAMMQLDYLLNIVKGQNGIGKTSSLPSSLSNLITLTEAIKKAQNGLSNGDELKNFVNQDSSQKGGFTVKLPREVQEGLIKTNSTKEEVSNSTSDFAVLDQTQTEGLDKEKRTYKAIITQMANAAIKVGLSKSVKAEQLLADQLKVAYQDRDHPFFMINFDDNVEADYLIDITSDRNFILTNLGSSIPLFKRGNNPNLFLQHVNSMGKWTNTLELKNTVTAFRKDDFIFRFEKIEGQEITRVNRELVTGKKWELSPGEEIAFSYINNQQPAFRLSIEIAENSTLQSCFAGVLYLDSKYGITTDLIPSDSGQLFKKGSPLQLGMVVGGRTTGTIQLNRDPKYDLYNINEIIDYLKIIISSKSPELSLYQQKSLELDTLREINRESTKSLETSENTENQTDWTVFDFKFRIVGPNKEKTLVPGSLIDFSAFTIEVPQDFSAKAFAVTHDDVLRKQQSNTLRGVDEKADALINNIVPPSTLWGEAITDRAFSTGLATGANNDIQALELVSLNGLPLILPEGQSLIIRPKNSEIISRDIEDEEEVIIPFGLDESLDLWYPLGTSDAEGNIHIDFLPAPTGGLIQGDEPLTKSPIGSVKLFFRKLFRKKSGVNTLALYKLQTDGEWLELTKELTEIKRELEGKPNVKVVLLIHGLTGDTRHIVAALKDLKELPQTADYILTYDYESLSTPIDDAAKILHKKLTEIGFGDPLLPKIKIIAHSQGGVMSRWMVEQEGGNAYVTHLILVACAGGGSELAVLGSTVFSLLTHAINVTGPIKMAITGLSILLKALKSDPGRTLKDTDPNSKFTKKLSNSQQPVNVKYNVIIGDLALIDRDFDSDDKFLQKLKKVIADKLIVPWLTKGLFEGEPNDIAVTHRSAVSIKNYENTPVNTRIVASNHLAYFRKELAQKELLEFLQFKPNSNA